MKAYNNFTDKFNNEYKFETFAEFAQFWFNQSRKALLSYFPNNFNELNKLASNSKEARTKINLA